MLTPEKKEYGLPEMLNQKYAAQTVVGARNFEKSLGRVLKNAKQMKHRRGKNYEKYLHNLRRWVLSECKRLGIRS